MALYTPSFPESARVSSFMRRINAAHGLSLTTYHELYKWSTENIDQFWSAVWDDTGIVGHKGSHVVDREEQRIFLWNGYAVSANRSSHGMDKASSAE